MKLQCLLLAPAVGLVVGEKTGIFDSARTETFCRTPYDTLNVTSVPTTHKTFWEVYRVNSTTNVSPIVTITPSPITQTTYTVHIATVESTTNGKPDETKATVLATEYTTVLVTNTMTTFTERTTETTEETTILPTTVPAPEFFVPIRDTIKGATRARDEGLPNNQSVGVFDPGVAEGDEYVPPGYSLESYFRAAIGGTRGVNFDNTKRKRKLKKRSGVYNNRGGKAFFPKKVVCDYTVFIPKTVTKTETAEVRTITVDPPVVWETFNNVITSTRTVHLPSIEVVTQSTTTFTIDSSIIASTTYTSVETKTNTVNVAWPTINAMCDKGNYAGSLYNAGRFSDGYPYFSYRTSQVMDTVSPYECCEACVADPTCAGSGWAKGICTLITVRKDSQCHNQVCSGAIKYSPSNGGSWVFSNGRLMKWDKVD